MTSRQKAFLYLVNSIGNEKENIREVITFLKSESGVKFAKHFELIDYVSLKHILGDHFMRWKQGMKGNYE